MWLWQRWSIVSFQQLKIIYRGLNSNESKTQFTYVNTIGTKNISKIFAGGNHSWFILDENIPIREHFRPPSPLVQISNNHDTSHNLMSPLTMSPKNQKQLFNQPFTNLKQSKRFENV